MHPINIVICQMHIVSVYYANIAKDMIAKQAGKKALHANFKSQHVSLYRLVGSGDVSKNFTRKLIFFGGKCDHFRRSLEPCNICTFEYNHVEVIRFTNQIKNW